MGLAVADQTRLFLFFACLGYVQRSIGGAGSFVVGVLEVLHEVQTQRMYESAQAAHGYVQRMAEYKDEYAGNPAPPRIALGHHGQGVEHAAKHAAGQTERIDTYVGKYVAQQTGSHAVGVPQAGTDIDERVALQVVQQENAHGNDATYHIEGDGGNVGGDHFQEIESAHADEAHNEQQP